MSEARTPLAAWELVPAALISVAFYALTLPHWDPQILWGPDTDKIFANVHLLLDHHELPGLGNGILPTRLRLGSAWYYLIGGLHALAGRDLWTTWVLLATTNLLAALGGVLALRRWLPPAVAWTFGAVLLSDPLLYAEQGFHPFWYQHYTLWLMVPVLVGCLGTLVEGRLGWWYLACGAAGLAAQYHAILWTLLPCGLLVAIQRRQTLGALQIAGGVALFVLACLPMVGQLPLLCDPANWVTMVTDRTDPAVRFSGAEAGLRFLRTLNSRVTGGALTLLLAAGALAWAARPSPPSPGQAALQALARLTWTWCAAIAVVFWVVSHRLHIHYGYLAIVPTAAAIAALVALAPERVTRSPSWTMGTLLVFLPRAAWPPEIEYGVPLDAPWAYHDLVVHTFERLGVEAGASREDVIGPGRRVHGFPCGWTGSRICAHEYTLHLLHGPGLTGPEHLSVRLEPGQGAVFERWTPCVRPLLDEGNEALTLLGDCEGPPRHALVVLAAPAAPDDRPWPRLQAADQALWEVVATIQHHPDRTRNLVVQTRQALPWTPGTTADLQIPPGYTVDDVFTSAQPWRREHFGLDPTGPTTTPP